MSSTTTADPITDAPSAPSLALTASDRLAAAEKIVKKDMYWSMGVGAVPVPIVDLVGIGAFQVRMLKRLSDLYGVKFSEHLAKNAVAALIGTIGARALTAATVSSLIKTLPFAGALVGGVLAMPAIAGATTYAMGRLFIRHFEAGGTFEDLNLAKAKSFFTSQFREGQKKVATEAAPAS